MKQTAGISRRWLAIILAFLLTAVALDAYIFWKKPAQPVSPAPLSTALNSATQSDRQEQSTTEAARRAAIAALGPLKHRGANAADLYKQAEILYAQLTGDEKAMLGHPRKDIDHAAAAVLYAKLQSIMDLLRSARKADYLDWGTGPMRPDSDISMRYILEREISTAALWESDYRFQSDPDGAVGDLAALDSMGRNSTDSLMGAMIQNAIHQSIVTMLAQNMPAIAADAGTDLSDILSTAAEQQAFQNGMTAEAAMQQAIEEDYNNPATRNASYIQFMMTKGQNPPSSSELQWAEQVENAFAATLTEPDAQFQSWWSQQLSQSASMPFASQLLPQLAAIRTQMQASLVQNAMLQAGLAVEQSDQSALQSILDPITGQPFTYTQTVDGFQLASTLQKFGKPVTLNFTTPVK